MKGFRYTIVFGALALLVLFLLYPLSLVLDASLRVNGTGTFTLANYAQIFASKYYLGSIGNSLLAATLAALGATLIGTPLAFCLARVDMPGKTVLLTLATLPLVLPSFVKRYANPRRGAKLSALLSMEAGGHPGSWSLPPNNRPGGAF